MPNCQELLLRGNEFFNWWITMMNRIESNENQSHRCNSKTPPLQTRISSAIEQHNVKLPICYENKGMEGLHDFINKGVQGSRSSSTSVLEFS